MNQSVERTASKLSSILFDVFLLGLPLFGMLPMLAVQTRQIVSQNFSLGFPIAWIALVILVFRTKRSLASSSSRYWLSLVCILLAVVLGLTATALFNSFFARLCFGFCFLAWAFVRLESASIWRILGMSLLIFASMKIPSQIGGLLDGWKNLVVIKIASPMLDLFKNFHLYEAPDLKLQNHTFDLADLLNTPMSVQMMVLVSIVVGLIGRRSFATNVVCALSAAFWTMIGYFIFVVIAVLLSQNGIDVMQSAFHYRMVLGGLILVNVIMVIISDGFWNSVLQPIGLGGESAVFRSGTANFFNRVVGWPEGNSELDDEFADAPKPIGLFKPVAIFVGLVLALLGIPTGLAVFRNDMLLTQGELTQIPLERRPDASTIQQDFIPRQTIRSFRTGGLGKFPSEVGGSSLWVFAGAGVETRITVVFPVPGWYDPKNFGLSNGDWARTKYGLQQDSSGWPFSESVFSSENGNSAILWSSQIRVSGDSYVPTEEEFAEKMSGESMAKAGSAIRIFDLMSGPREKQTNQTVICCMAYHVQGAIRETEKQRLLAKYLEARELVRQKMFGGGDVGQSQATPNP
jgi:uncharacterized membrane protein